MCICSYSKVSSTLTEKNVILHDNKRYDKQNMQVLTLYFAFFFYKIQKKHCSFHYRVKAQSLFSHLYRRENKFNGKKVAQVSFELKQLHGLKHNIFSSFSPTDISVFFSQNLTKTYLLPQSYEYCREFLCHLCSGMHKTLAFRTIQLARVSLTVL